MGRAERMTYNRTVLSHRDLQIGFGLKSRADLKAQASASTPAHGAGLQRPARSSFSTAMSGTVTIATEGSEFPEPSVGIRFGPHTLEPARLRH